MRVERILFSKGINRAVDPRYIGSDELCEAFNVEVIKAGTLSKRKGFGRWSTADEAVFSTTVRGLFLMYDRNGNRYLFIPFDRPDSPVGTNLRIQKNGIFLSDITAFFPSEGHRVRAAVFGDKIFFTNGVDRPRWYKEYDGTSHVWLIAGLPYPVRRIIDASYDFYLSRAIYHECITSSEGLGIEAPGIWQYKQTFGYHGFEENEQVEESNAGGQSRAFICQFNTAESLSATLEGYVKSPINLTVAQVADFLEHAGESGGQDYDKFMRWMRLYRRWKMFADQLYSPYEFLAEFKKSWLSTVGDVYDRDAAIVAPQAKVFPAAAHHVEAVNNRLFIGNISKQLFTQPSLPKNFRGLPNYKPNFQKRIPITIQNTNQRTMTAVTIPLRFTDQTDAGTVATPPAAGGDWTGAYLNTSLDLAAGSGGWWQMIFVDEDGVSPLGFFRIGALTLTLPTRKRVTFLVELPEIAAGGNRTIYLYFEDSGLIAANPEIVEWEVGHWKSVAHYRLMESSHYLLADFENWKSPMELTAVPQKRSLAFFWEGGGGSAAISSSLPTTRFFGDGSKYLFAERSLYVSYTYVPGFSPHQAGCYFYTARASLEKFSLLVAARVNVTAATQFCRVSIDRSDFEPCVELKFSYVINGGPRKVTASVWGVDGVQRSITLSSDAVDSGVYTISRFVYYLLTFDKGILTFTIVNNPNLAHPAATASWDTSSITVYSNNLTVGKNIRSDNTYNRFVIYANSDSGTAEIMVKEVEFTDRVMGGRDELIQLSMHDTYWNDMGYASVGEIESSTTTKFPDRFYFSELNSPNSWVATNFRDLGNRGDAIQGLRGLRNRLYIFSENQVRALFAAGAEQAIGAGPEDTMMWNLSNDLTGSIGGLGVIAPDSLVAMEFAGRDGLGFLSKRGFYFFDGQNFEHISLKVDNIIDYWTDEWKKEVVANFSFKKRQLMISSPYTIPFTPEEEDAQ